MSPQEARRAARRKVWRAVGQVLTGTVRGRILLTGYVPLLVALVAHLVVGTDASALALAVAIVVSLLAAMPLNAHTYRVLRRDMRSHEKER